MSDAPPVGSPPRASASRFQGRVAVITGGASGIGLACAEVLAAQGALVVIADLDLTKATSLASDIGGRAYAIDVGRAADIELLAGRIEQELGPVDMLVNSAGIIQGAAVPPEELPLETYDRVFGINLRGTYAACTAFGRRMAQRRRGSILNIASISGMRSTPCMLMAR